MCWRNLHRGQGQGQGKDRSRQLPALVRYGRDLSEEARRGLLDPVIGRQDVIQRTLQVRGVCALAHRHQSNCETWCVAVDDATVGAAIACAQVLLRRSKHNPLLIGEAGVGKTAIVEGIAQLMAAPTPPKG